MKNNILAATLAATLAMGVFLSPSAQADHIRVSVGVGDVIFEAGVPYYRVTREPIYVVYTNNTPTYYRIVTKTYKGKPAPPPWAPAYGWRMKSGVLVYGYYDAKGVWHWQ